MSDNINVGDRVRGAFTGRSGTVIAITEQWAWIRNSGEPFTIPLCNLTRIELEKITLTPRFGIGEKVKIRFGEVVKINAVVVAYRDNENWLWAEDQLEPIPTPCPTCKGSGKSEGSA